MENPSIVDQDCCYVFVEYGTSGKTATDSIEFCCIQLTRLTEPHFVKKEALSLIFVTEAMKYCI